MISSPFSTTGIKLVNEEQDGQQCHQYNESNHTLVVLLHMHAVQIHLVIQLVISSVVERKNLSICK